MDDVSLTFNAMPFKQGLGMIYKQLTQMNTGFQSFSATANAGTQKVKMGSIDLLKALTPIAMAYGAIKKGIQQIPEIGQAFNVAGDIIMKNLLWPLRQELIPLLQKMLDWVRDNRAMFLRWGNVIATAFRIIKSFVVGVIDIIKTFWNAMSQTLENTFGKSKKSIEDMVNIIMFKVAAVVEFIIALFKPIAKLFGEIFGKMLIAAKSFFDGFVDGVSFIGKDLEYLVDMFKELYRVLSSSENSSINLVKIFKVLGQIVGTVVGGAIMVFVSALDSLGLYLKRFGLQVEQFKAGISGDLNKYNMATKAIEREELEYMKREADRGNRFLNQLKKIRNTITDNQEQVIQNNKKIEQQEKKVIAPAGQVNKTQNLNQQKTITNNPMTNNININVTGGPTGKDTAQNISKEFVSTLKENMVLSGGR